MITTTLYESGSTDGYRDSGDGIYFKNSPDAARHANTRHGAFGRVIVHENVMELDGLYYKLVSKKPIALHGSKEELELIKERALNKLTKEEIKALGLE